MWLGFRIGLLVLEHSHPEKLSYSILSSFFLREFQSMTTVLMIIIYHQIKILISFWCRRGLNPRSLIQSSEILPVELIGTYSILSFLKAILSIKHTKYPIFYFSIQHIKIIYLYNKIFFSLNLIFFFLSISTTH